MAKVTLSDITAGYASASALNTTFNILEDHFNNQVLYRNNPSGEPNQMENNLDMNDYDLLNVGDIQADSITINGVEVITQMNTIYNNYLALVDRVTVSTASPSGGSDGDIWFKVSA